jgi:hypothetical protein
VEALEEPKELDLFFFPIIERLPNNKIKSPI